MQTDKIIFEEKQYMGHNRLSIIWRTVLTVFCFIGYYWSQNPKPVQVSVFEIGYYPAIDIPNSGKIFFLLGHTLTPQGHQVRGYDIGIYYNIIYKPSRV